MESKRAWEAEQINKMLDELQHEPLCNILLYAAWYLKDYMQRSPDDCRLASDKHTMNILNKYAELLVTRLEDPRD